MKDKQLKNQVSPQKLAANRKNAKRSTGPRTPKGKQQARQNSYVHGFYGMRLFPSEEILTRDWAGYKRIFDVYWSHYLPVGDLEKIYLEKIAAESLRLARLFGHEQKVFAWGAPLEQRSVSNIVRYEGSVSRHLDKAIDRLERLQEARKAESNRFEPSNLESDDAIWNPDETTDERSEAPEELIPEEPQGVSTSSRLPDAPLTTTQPHVETSVKQGSAPTDMESLNKPTENVASDLPPDNSIPSACEQKLAKAVEHAMDPTPAEQRKSGTGSGEHYGTVGPYPRRLAETAGNVEMIERIKSVDDLDQLEPSS